ncbi:MAG: hypothetical protein ACMVO5_00970 [Polymorphobacter sp.]|uniref:hypothetical protein n=1 Tax=Polymorphobacter sp. TaxID=1909290 RepID=UPI003A8AB296
MRAVIPVLLPPVLLLLAACGGSKGVSLGRMGGAPPSLIITSTLVARDTAIGTVTLTEEVQGDRIVIRASGLPEGRHKVMLHSQPCPAAGAQTDTLPPLESDAEGKSELYADLPSPRLRGSEGARLAGPLAVTVSIAGERFACADIRYKGNSGAIDGD